MTERDRRMRLRGTVPGRLGMIAALTVLTVLPAGLLPAPASAAPAPASARAVTASAAPGGRVITYHGYQVTVPASWPVYDLAADPSRCVLFNKNAVYLGTPGTSQSCPARAYGRAGAILIQPATSGAAAGPAAIRLPAGTASLPAGAALPAAAARADAISRTIRVAVPRAGVLVTASYGNDQPLIRSILAGARAVAAQSPQSPQSPQTAQSPQATPVPQAPQAARASAPAAGTAAAAGTGAGTGIRASTGTADLAGIDTSGLGFDTCTVPSAAAMTDWLASPYRVIGTYLGGVNWACDYGNFSASWVQQAAAEGWRFIPIWVGEQAPCSTIPGAVLINPAGAAAEGAADAASAVSTAQGFGYGRGSAIYYDMEGYDSSDTACNTAVLTFLSAWTQGLHAAGYLSGVYSSAGSGIAALAAAYGSTAYTSPDDIWIADWDGDPVLSDPYVPAADWAGRQRLRQYAGSHDETWGGVTVDIDSDIIGGPVSGLPGARPDPGPSLLRGTDAVTVAPGGTVLARLTAGGAAGERWHVSAPAGVTVRPDSGTVPPGRGRPAVITLVIHAGPAAAAGRHDVPVTFTEDRSAVAQTFLLVSVTPPGTALPAPSPVVLYAADPASMAAAVAVARDDALPAADVTGDYSQAWSDVAAGNDIVIAVGAAAVDGLFYNACGWANPGGLPAGESPFYWLGTPFSQPPGADVYVPADGTTAANSALLAAQLAHYALAGTLPGYGRPPALLPRPADTCLGSPNVPVPGGGR